ncbi:hypothetical protein B0H14DRAFT_1329452 [Mycena olivaceomarginata]|nr:hypothetical protein B0H14DRAFT_1329452 [Mycena olivaceomarginata]
MAAGVYKVPNEGLVPPRLIKVLPPKCTEMKLYDLLRPYGSIHSLRIHPTAGGIVQFWNNIHALAAEKGLAAKMALQPFDPWSLYCSNLSSASHPSALRTHFAKYEGFERIDILPDTDPGKSRRGIMVFSDPSQASRALQDLQGVEIEGQLLSVSFLLLRPEGVHSWEMKWEDFIQEDKAKLRMLLRREKEETVRPFVQMETREGSRLAEVEESRRKMEQFQEQENAHKRAAKRPERQEAWEKAQREEEHELEERTRAAEVEDSRRKMGQFQEHEKARKRAAEEADRQGRPRFEAEDDARRGKEARERGLREKEEQQRKTRELREREELERRWRDATQTEEQRCSLRDQQMRGTGLWTPGRATDRLKLQIGEFSKIKFSEAQPLTFRVIPWPVLTDPLVLDFGQINWDEVEAFFSRAKTQFAVDVAEYKSLVEKVHRLFHPDKWRSRGLLLTVMDEGLRKSLEEAGNVVAQAMTPIWRKSKGYDT